MGEKTCDLVVVGLGYVGLPLVQGAVRAGLQTCGYDRSQEVVTGLSAGRSHVDDLSDGEIVELRDSGFGASTDPDVLGSASTIVICVPTPLSAEGGPDLRAIEGAGRAISERLQPGTLVVLESTTWPGTTEEVLKPILESHGLVAGRDFWLAFSPERIDPGNATYGLRNTPKVVGGYSEECGDEAEKFYSQIVDRVVRAQGTREAEMAKLLENTYRHINIALVNEMAKFSHELGIDLWDVIRCARTKPFGFQAFYPGPGVGGHCIPIDPNYLSHRVRLQLGYPFRFVELAQEVNLSMPQYIARRAQDSLNDQGKPVRGSRVLILGVTYKPGIADERESPARPLASLLAGMGAHVDFFDPFVETWNVGGDVLARVPELSTALAGADLILHLQPHASYDNDVIVGSSRPVLDTRGVLHGDNVEAL